MTSSSRTMDCRARARSSAAVLLLACIVSVAAFAQTAEDPGVAPNLDTRIEVRSIDDLDWVIDARKRLVWAVREQSEQAGPDRVGRTLEQYADQFVFTEELEAKLQTLRRTAGEQATVGDQNGLNATLRQASELVTHDLEKLLALHGYYHVLGVVSRHEAALQALMDKSPEAERAGTRARIDPMLNALPEFMESRLSAPPFPDVLSPAVLQASFNPLFAAYNEERQRLAVFASASDREHGLQPLSMTPTVPCEGPGPAMSEDGGPKIDRSMLSLPVYPEDAKRYSFEGQVIVRVAVAANGCPVHVQIERTVGYELLDQTALEWAAGLRFHPASKNGKPFAAVTTIAATFGLTD